jgi:hypothetical protein
MTEVHLDERGNICPRLLGAIATGDPQSGSVAILALLESMLEDMKLEEQSFLGTDVLSDDVQSAHPPSTERAGQRTS